MGALPGLQLLGLQLSSIVRRHPIALQLLLPLCRRRSLFLASESAGDRPRLGGDVEVARSLVLFSNIARRFRTPLLLADMTMSDE
jgi:hypothetical protein